MIRITLLVGVGLLAFGRIAGADGIGAAVAAAAIERTEQRVRYDGRYRAIDYPMGDVPADTGVCTDLVIRTLRRVNIDLQRHIHEDMRVAFDAYPSHEIWGLTRPDKNIDHRRVPNLRTFFARHALSLTVGRDLSAFEAGDIVTWRLPGNLPHIGVVTEQRSANGNPLIAHNIGSGPVLEDMLFDYPITAHFRLTDDFARQASDN